MLIERDRENFYILNFLDQFMEGHKGFIAGGCFKNIFNHEKIKDLDIFFENEADFAQADQYYNDSDDYFLSYENDNVKAYKHEKTGIILELCRKTFGTAQEVVENFDFTITKFAYYKVEVADESPFNGVPNKDTHIEYRILCDDHFFEHLHMKCLVTDDKILFPMSTFERMIRYIKYGYMPCKETKLKIATAINNLDEKEIDVANSLYDGMD